MSQLMLNIFLNKIKKIDTEKPNLKILKSSFSITCQQKKKEKTEQHSDLFIHRETVKPIVP